MRKFETYDVAMELAAAMGPVIAKLKRRDSDLSNQLKRAVASIPMNLSEGAQRKGQDRVQHYRVAAGSAAEVGTALDLALSWSHVSKSEVCSAQQLLDRVRALLWRLLESNGDRSDARPPAPGPVPGPRPRSRDPDPEAGSR